MELKKLPHIEIEVAPLPGKKLPAAVNTLRKLDVKKVGLIAGGTAAVLTVVSVAGRYGIYRGAVAAELKRQLAAVAALYFVDSTAFEGLLPSVMSALSLFERFYTFVNGVFDLTAVFYYLTVAALFLFLSVQSLEKRRYN